MYNDFENLCMIFLVYNNVVIFSFCWCLYTKYNHFLRHNMQVYKRLLFCGLSTYMYVYMHIS